jgi:ribosomal protein S18 acetylase RimI-like enzyme
VSIRLATEADHDSLRALWQAFEDELVGAEWWHEPWEEAWESLREQRRDGCVLAAELDGAVVGYAAARLRDPRIAHLADIYVAPRARRCGIGRALIRGVTEWAQAHGAQAMTLSVDIANANARALYRRLGFREHSVRLEVALDPLAERISGEASRVSFGSLHVQTDDERAVQRAVAQFLPRVGRTERTEVSTARNGWVTVVDELCDRDRSAQRRLGSELSERLGVPVVAFALEEETVVRFLLFDRGRMVDEYLSVPTYYGALNTADELSLAANPTLVARLTGADPNRVRAVARVASSPADLPPPRELLREIADVMNLEARIER